ncbi:MAG TPA: hypothetical protein VMU57_13205, partial [Edaphobacter sp.]|nr:hypothetical protein [Edaphobacter sp.]
IGLLRGAAALGEGNRPNAMSLLSQAESWRPWRAYAAQHLWAVDPVLMPTRRQSDKNPSD